MLAMTPLQLRPGGLHVGFLLVEVGVSFLHPLELLHSPQVHRTQGADGFLQLGDLGRGLSLQGDADGLGRLMAEAVAVPEAVQETGLLHLRLEFFLLQNRRLPLEPQLLLVGLPGGPLRLDAAALQVHLARRVLREGLGAAHTLCLQVLVPAGEGLDLLRQGLIFLDKTRQVRFAPVPLPCRGRQLAEIGRAHV